MPGPAVLLPPPPAKFDPGATTNLKDALVAEVRKSLPMAYNTLITHAQRMTIEGDRVVLTFLATDKFGPAFDKYRAAIEAIATKLAGRKMTLVADAAGKDVQTGAVLGPVAQAERKSALREQALADASVQALLEVFPAEIRDVEEM